jgi:N utilization substance protein B
MIRRIAREIVLQSLFQIDFSGCDAESALEASLAEHEEKDAAKAKAYAEKTLQGVLEHLAAIDGKIGEYAIDWTVERMSATDRNILRVAVYEMMFAEEKIVPGIAINEAVEIAKRYGTEESPRFINGILGKMVR